jgi:hypothetical protein
MTEHLPHEPHKHVHHYAASDCTVCAYIRMEQAYNQKLEDLIDEVAPRTAEDTETG